MILEKNTSPAELDIISRTVTPTEHSTSVGLLHGSPNRFLIGNSTMPVSPVRRTSAGLVLLKSMPLAQCAPVLRRISRTLSLKPYAQTLELLRRHQNTLRKRERDPHLQMNLAWISLSESPVEFNKRALESFELSLSHTLFLETRQPQQGIEALCAESQFDAIVAELPTTPVILKRAQRWLKPTAHNPLKPESANMLETHPRERLFILIEDSFEVRR